MTDANTLTDFDKQVDASFNDLTTFPHDQIVLMAKQMDIPGCKDASHKNLCRQVARKVVYINSDILPDINNNKKCIRYTKKINSEQLNSIRETIYDEFIEYRDSVTTMSSDVIHQVFKRYDELCFDGDIQEYMNEQKYSLQFRTSGEETFTTEGVCALDICDYKITIPIEYFNNIDGITNVAGHYCKDQLECLLRVIEHELIHLVIFMFCSDPFITDQHGPLFMKMAKDLFDHSDHRHYIF